MGLGILQRKFQTQSRTGIDQDVLQACIGEKIKITTDLYFENVSVCSTDNIITFFPDPIDSGQLVSNNLIMFSDTSFLDNCQVGDVFSADALGANGAGPWILLEIISGGLGRFNSTFTNELRNGGAGSQYIANVTPLKGLIYQFGIGSSSFNSLTDGSIQKFSIQASARLDSLTIQMMSPAGYKDWQVDSASVTGLGNTSGWPSLTHVGIRIIHDTIVSPFYLAGQYDNMRLGLPPDYFKPDNKLRYSSQADWNKSNTYLSDQKSISAQTNPSLDDIGQFGWYGTKYDGSKPDYAISSLTIKRISDSTFVNQLEYDEVEVKFTITGSGAALSSTDSALIFGFNFLPEDPNFYQKTDRLLTTNFCFDNKLFNPDGTVVNGDNFGTDKQVIKTIKGDVISPTQVNVTVRILFGADQVAILQQGDTAQYSMWIMSENTALDISLSDKCNLLVQVDVIHVELTKVDLLTAVTKFIEHPYDIAAAGLDTLQMFPVDDVVANSIFGLDYTGLETDEILLKTCTPQIVLTHASEADIVLDSAIINLEGYPTVGSNPAVQATDFNQLRPYKIEDGIRKYIGFERDYAADSGSVKYFALNFPFMNRWEYWLQIAGIINIPSTLFDSTVPFNGANHLWNRLANSSGWSLKYRVTFNIQQNGQLFEQEFEYDLTSTYFESNTDWNNCNIKSYDLSTGDEITVGPKKYVYNSKDVRIKAYFEKTVGSVPDIANIAIVIWAEGYEGGGITEITRISSVYEVTDVSLFKSLDSSNLVIVSSPLSGVFTGEAIIKADKLQGLSKLSLYARIYEVTAIDESERVTNDYILRITNDGFARIVLS